MNVRRVATFAGSAVGVFLVCQLLGAWQLDSYRSELFGVRTPIPVEVMLQAVVTGCIQALFAVGIVLVYRATRIINFAHAGFGLAASVLFVELMTYIGWSWWLSFPLAVVAAGAAGYLVELFFVRRFARKTRLVLTVMSIAVGQGLAGLALAIPGLFGDDQARAITLDTPFSGITREIGVIIFTGDHAVAIVASAFILTAMAVFFARSRRGIAIRGAAENEERAAMLGIRTGNLSAFVWTAAAALSGLAGVLGLSIGSGASVAGVGTTVGLGVLLRALFVAILGRMDNLVVTAYAAVLLAVFESSVFFAFSQTAIVDALVLVLTIVALLVQRKTLVRTDETGTAWAASDEVRPIPKELASLPTVRSATRRVQVGAAAVLVVVPWVLSPRQTNSASLFAIYGIVIVSLVVLTGWGGQVSLGQFGFVGVGALVGGWLLDTVGAPFPIALLIGSLAGAGVAIVLGLPALRIRGLYLAVTTLAFGVVASTVMLNPRYAGGILPRTVNRPKLLWVRFEDERAYYYLCVVALTFAVFVALGIRRSRSGRVLIAMRDNERTAQSYGVNLVRTRLATFAISGFLAAFAGVLFAVHQHAVSQTSFPPEQSVTIFLMAVIGGLGSVIGSLSGALFFGGLEIFSSSLIVELLSSFAGIAFVLLVLPGGLGAAAFKVRDAYLRRVAIRQRIYVPSLLGQFGMVHGEMARIPLTPKLDGDGQAAKVEARYRRASRIGVAGASQSVGWFFGD